MCVLTQPRVSYMYIKSDKVLLMHLKQNREAFRKLNKAWRYNLQTTGSPQKEKGTIVFKKGQKSVTNLYI